MIYFGHECEDCDYVLYNHSCEGCDLWEKDEEMTCIECGIREGFIETRSAEHICQECFEDEGYEECQVCGLVSKECSQDDETGLYTCPDCE